MSTKNHPGQFRCFEAALPDEPMFVILGRDPAGPATLEYWAQQRIQQGKVHEPDDRDRIKAAVDEARDMAEWRQRMLDHAEETGELPVWKLPRPLDDGPPVREISLPPIVGHMRPQDHEVMVSVGKAVRAIANDLNEWLGERAIANARTGQLKRMIDLLHEEVEKLAEAARRGPRQHVTPVEFEYYPDPDGDPIKVKPLSFTRMSELLDYATAYGEFDENTPNGTQPEYPNISTPMNDVRRGAIWAYKRAMGIIPDGLQLPVAEEEVTQQMTMAVYTAGLFLIPGHEEPQTMDQIAEVYRIFHTPTPKMPTVDSQPDDLAHAPEVPHHRFSVFHTSGDYAYARGLEVNPMHLPTALDAMAKSNWHLCAIFGQTDAQHIGFIFRRDTLPPRDLGFDLAHGLHGGFPSATRREDKPVDWPADFKGTEIDCVKEIKALDARESAGLIDSKEAAVERARLISDCPEWGRGLAI